MSDENKDFGDKAREAGEDAKKAAGDFKSEAKKTADEFNAALSAALAYWGTTVIEVEISPKLRSPTNQEGTFTEQPY